MTSKNFLLLAAIALAAFLGACALFDDDDTPLPQPLPARIACADVTNAGEASRCGEQSAWQIIKQVHARDVQTGDVSRGELIETAQEIDNRVSPVTFRGWVRGEFDAGCNGAPSWEILPLQPISVQAGEAINFGVGGQCGDMPTGERVFTVSLYSDEGITLVDQVRVLFRLTE